jgi:hypothetical protein
VEPAKVPQHLELDDVIAFGLGALDLLCLAAGAVAGWWLALTFADETLWRVALASPLVVAGLVLGIVRIGERPCRSWLALAVAYALRAHVLVTGVAS